MQEDGFGQPPSDHLLLRGPTSRVAYESGSAASDALGAKQLHEAAISRGPWSSFPADGGGARLDGTGVCGSSIPEEWLRKASTAGEALFLALHAAATAVSATAGLLHRRREPFIGLVTSSAHGQTGTQTELGQVIASHDPALAVAKEHDVLLGSPTRGPAERAIARRLSACGVELLAVAMVPIFDGDALLAMLELGRADHPFRSDDTTVLRTIAALVGLP